MADAELSRPPRLPRQGTDHSSVLQRALACGLAGRLDCALALIRGLREPDPSGGPTSSTPC